MTLSFSVLAVAASIWQLAAADIGAFTFPAPSGDSSDLPTYCIDEHINIRWTASTSQDLGMILWQNGTGKTDSNFGKFGNTGNFGWYIDTGLDYTAAPFYFAMYIFGSTTPQFSSGLFNIDVCDSSGTGTGTSTGAGSDSDGATATATISGSISGSSPSASSNPSPASPSGSATVTVTQGSRTSVVNNAATSASKNNGPAAEGPLNAVAAGVLGSWLLAVL